MSSTIKLFKETAEMCFALSQGLYTEDLSVLEKKLNTSALKLEAAAKILYEVEREYALVDLQEEFVHHSFIQELFKGNHKPEVTLETDWLHILHNYNVIRITRFSPNGHLVFEKEGARIGGKEYYHSSTDSVPNSRLDFEIGKAYLVYQDDLKDYTHFNFKHVDGIWTFAQELTENEARFITKSLAPVFVQAKKKKIKY